MAVAGVVAAGEGLVAEVRVVPGRTPCPSGTGVASTSGRRRTRYLNARIFTLIDYCNTFTWIIRVNPVSQLAFIHFAARSSRPHSTRTGRQGTYSVLVSGPLSIAPPKGDASPGAPGAPGRISALNTLAGSKSSRIESSMDIVFSKARALSGDVSPFSIR